MPEYQTKRPKEYPIQHPHKDHNNGNKNIGHYPKQEHSKNGNQYPRNNRNDNTAQIVTVQIGYFYIRRTLNRRRLSIVIEPEPPCVPIDFKIMLELYPL